MPANTLVYLGHYETSFRKLHADQDHYWTKPQTEDGHVGKPVDPVPERFKGGVHFGLMQTNDGFIFVRVNRLVLPTPVLFIGGRHGPEAPGLSWSEIGPEATLNILADAIVASPGFRDELIRFGSPIRRIADPMSVGVGSFLKNLPAMLKSLWKIFAAIASVVVITTCAVMGYWTSGCVLAFAALPGVVYDVFTVRDRGWRRALLVAYLVLFVSVIWVFAGLFFERGLFDGHDLRVNDFWDAVYFSAITWTTVGYGDIRPGPSVRLWAAAEAIYGYVYMALLVAQVVQLLVDAASVQKAASVDRADGGE